MQHLVRRWLSCQDTHAEWYEQLGIEYTGVPISDESFFRSVRHKPVLCSVLADLIADKSDFKDLHLAQVTIDNQENCAVWRLYVENGMHNKFSYKRHWILECFDHGLATLDDDDDDSDISSETREDEKDDEAPLSSLTESLSE